MAIVETYPIDAFEVPNDGTTLLEECKVKEGELYEAECPICHSRIFGKVVPVPNKKIWDIADIPANWYYDGSCDHFYASHSSVSISEGYALFHFGGVIDAEDDPRLIEFLKSHQGSWA